LNATYIKACDNHRIGTLRDRGLDGVRPVISDAHAG